MLYAKKPIRQKRTAFRSALASGRLLRFPGAFSPLVSMLIEQMGFDRYDSVEEALAAAFSRQGPQDKIGVIPYGGHTYCYPADA